MDVSIVMLIIINFFFNQINRLSHLLARRRIPGEHRRRSHFTEERRLIEILNPPDIEVRYLQLF